MTDKKSRLNVADTETINSEFGAFVQNIAVQLGVTEEAVMVCCMHRGVLL